MSSCDLCGKNGPTVFSKIEGVPYRTCTTCATYGKRVQTVTPKKQYVHKIDNRTIIADFSSQLRSARSKKGVTQKDLAMQLGVKESVLHAWEAGSRKPTVAEADRVGRALHVSLLETEQQFSSSYSKPRSSGGGLTIADMMKKR